jgi:hypothetical protein
MIDNVAASKPAITVFARLRPITLFIGFHFFFLFFDGAALLNV